MFLMPLEVGVQKGYALLYVVMTGFCIFLVDSSVTLLHIWNSPPDAYPMIQNYLCVMVLLSLEI
jgi:hypothetical protein